MRRYERRRALAEWRDTRHIEKLHQVGTPPVGALFDRWINQADRSCRVFATHGPLYAYDYEMPSGATFVRIGNRATARERPVSRKAAPRWALAAWPA